MYSKTYFLLSSVLAALSMSSTAQAAQVDCVLEVGGRAYISGPCAFERLSGDNGNFRINALDDAYFAYVYMKSETTAEAFWNEDPEYRNAQSPLGTLTQDGACWVSDTARICAVEKTASSSFDFRQTPELTAYQPVVDKLFAVLGSPEMASTASPPSVVSEAIWVAVADDTSRLRYTAGADAEAYMAARSAQDDATFISGVKAQCGLGG